ncbi:histidine kinase dimerization/phospho-acceptor domain-containing protein [Desulfuromonas sp.]|uniref:sensor histidine kinase n=1 Tax=Desulfuromonas sp. TaxID=892 RepID=UPI0034284770
MAEAEDARDKIDAILKSVADGLVVADLSGRVVLMNRAAEKLFGVSLSMAIYRPLAALLTDKGLGVQVASALNGEEGMAPVEWDLFDDQGKPSRVVQARTAPVQGMDGKRSGTITTFRDVTREREIDRMKSEFISTAAHELRTPLTSVKGFSELLIQNPGFDPKERTDFLSIIYEKSGVLEKIIDDLLDLSRVESGRVIYLEKEPCDLGTVVGQAVSQYQAEFTHYRFSTLLPDAPLTLSLDRGKIGQVMENLLSNAVKFSKQGSAIEIGCRR